MKAIEWDDSLSVHIPEIDDQHKRLIDLINDLDETMAGQDQPKVHAVIEGLKDYTIVHFECEESLLAKNDYPQLKSHQLEHWEFVKKVGNFDQGQSLGLPNVREGIIRFLTQWLIKHIRGTDHKYAVFLKKKQAS